MKTFLRRLATAAIAVPVAFWALTWEPQAQALAVAIAAGVAGWELGRMVFGLDKGGRLKVLGCTCVAAALPLHAFLGHCDSVMVLLLANLLLFLLAWSAGWQIVRLVCTVLCLSLYVGGFLSYVPCILALPRGRLLCASVLIVTWSCDGGAYIVGKTFGRHKLCPGLSPSKTVEGAVGGILVATLVTSIILSTSVAFDVLSGILYAFILACTAIVGDLFESAIKRFYGCKDSGNLLPGYGGVLDRLDSLLFTLPAAYYILSLARPCSWPVGC